ncbi:MAG: hypothetical protein A2151_04800 [Candidatus Muproteobacteria bacterium RBG_16_65_34]|uniref:GTPase n=1 Tax=Candidatus Muproteobacteria bacterium RBG_16_65_34 TaxID=1817760 RepID=A0A1F6TKC3_9PROT|nr:MAG: hypothetical protein A2151_04800 [Candidatus Muproteobacteria bacterium RBG_16_65_34]
MISEACAVEFTFSIPAKRVSAWSAETEPKAARAWLATLPLADAAETARELYQSLYALNRMKLDASRRFDLMELHRDPVAQVSSALLSDYARLPLALTARMRPRAELARELHREMAYGYKCTLQDMQQSWRLPGKRRMLAASAERAMRALGEVLLRSYQAYLPYPAGVWKEIHALYLYSEANGWLDEPLDNPDGGPDVTPLTLERRYLQILLLGLCNPYQLPQGAGFQIHRFLETWSAKARLQRNRPAGAAGCFLVDTSTDAPPFPVSSDTTPSTDTGHRVLHTIELVQTIHVFMLRLQKGESVSSGDLRLDCTGQACLDLLRRMMRAWGAAARRQHTRMKRRGYLSLCSGVPALHFFSSGRPASEPAQAEPDTEGHAFAPAEEGIASDSANAAPARALYRIDRWQIRDIGPQGLALSSRVVDVATAVRIGDVIGVQRVNAIGRWSAGVVRWFKHPEVDRIEIGVELLAPEVTAVMAAPVSEVHSLHPRYAPALLLPAVAAVNNPPALLVSRGLYEPGMSLSLRDGDQSLRTARLLKFLERADGFDLFAFAVAKQI